MTKRDTLQRFIFDNAPVRGELVHIEESFQTILDQHQYPEPIQRLLGEALCVAVLLAAIIKFDGRLTVQFRGKGNLKLLLVQCDNQFRLRGLIKWEGDLSYDELMNAFHDGVLVIMLDSGLKNRYQGIVSWRGNSLAESIEAYFKHSEQLSTKIWLTVDKKSAAGFLLQVMPSSDKHFSAIESEIVKPHWERLTALAMQIKPEKLLQETNEQLLQHIYPDEIIRVFPVFKVAFECTCSRKRSEDAILILGRDEAEQELQNNQTIIVTCDFCNKEYIFDRIDITMLFETNDKPPHSQLH